MIGDLKSNVDVQPSIQPQAHTATVDGSGVDLTADEVFNAAMVCIVTGDYTDGSFTMQVQEKDSGGSWSAVADSDLDGSEPTISASGDADSVFFIGYEGRKEQVRVQISSVSGSPTTGAEICAFVMRGAPRSGAVN